MFRGRNANGQKVAMKDIAPGTFVVFGKTKVGQIISVRPDRACVLIMFACHPNTGRKLGDDGWYDTPDIICKSNVSLATAQQVNSVRWF